MKELSMDFLEFRDAIYNNISNCFSAGMIPVIVSSDKNEIWDIYFNSIPENENPVYRQRHEYDCNACKHFFNKIGGLVFIDGQYDIHSIWDIETPDKDINTIARKIGDYVKSKFIRDVFLSDSKVVGIQHNYGQSDNDEIIRYDHFYADIPQRYVGRKSDIQANLAQIRDDANVFRRTLNEISEYAISVVLELISSNSLYKGKEWEIVLNKLLAYKKEYDKLDSCKKEPFIWFVSANEASYLSRIKNHSIGVLLQDITSGLDINVAVDRYEKIVAPENYKRPKPIFTYEMARKAKDKIVKLGLGDSLKRRFATIDDISVSNTLFVDRNIKKVDQSNDVFAEIMSCAKHKPIKFDRVSEIGIDDFIDKVLPNANSVEAYIPNTLTNNFVSLIAPKISGSKSLLKWNNGFGWAYTGNITDSSIKQNVAKSGGNVNGVLRFSIQWNDGDDYNPNDFDAHCIEPSGYKIHYANRRNSRTKGMLDIDVVVPQKNCPAVENITWPDITYMDAGIYKFYVNTFCNRYGTDGFKAEIECDGKIYSFKYSLPTKTGENVAIATVKLDTNGQFHVHPDLDLSVENKKMWGINLESFVPVSMIMYSPNYWVGENGIGNKHYFFMLNGCINDESPNGFYNEFLSNDLAEHRKVFEAVAARMSVEDSDEQLSGVGFSSTKRAELIVKVRGNVEKILKIKF